MNSLAHSATPAPSLPAASSPALRIFDPDAVVGRKTAPAAAEAEFVAALVGALEQSDTRPAEQRRGQAQQLLGHLRSKQRELVGREEELQALAAKLEIDGQRLASDREAFTHQVEVEQQEAAQRNQRLAAEDRERKEALEHRSATLDHRESELHALAAKLANQERSLHIWRRERAYEFTQLEQALRLRGTMLESREASIEKLLADVTQLLLSENEKTTGFNESDG